MASGLRNLAVKFAILSARWEPEQRADTQAYLELSPEAMLERYQSLLGVENRGVVMFGFSGQAVIDILDEEFEIDMERNGLLFRKTYLDARSIRLAGAGRASTEDYPFTETELTLVGNLADWLLEATRSLYRGDLNDERLQDIRQEYRENFRVYACKAVSDYEAGEAEDLLRSLFGSVKAMRAFCHSLTVDALFKGDAAKVLFGETSGYYQAWFRKQLFRHMMSRALEAYISACLID